MDNGVRSGCGCVWCVVDGGTRTGLFIDGVANVNNDVSSNERDCGQRREARSNQVFASD